MGKCWSCLQEHQIKIDQPWFFDCNARKTENNSRNTDHLTDDLRITYYPENAEKSKLISVELSNADVQS
jgi:hypothetical protein